MEKSRRELTSVTENFPLSSKRLKIHQLQELAKAMGLPSALGDDMLVMICGKLTKENHDPSNVQVVATKTEEGQQLCLEDLDGVFLTVPVSPTEFRTSSPVLRRELSVPTLVSDSSRTTPDSEVLIEPDDHTLKEQSISFSNEERHLDQVLSKLNTELGSTRLQLQAAQEKVTVLKEELSAQQTKLLETLQELQKEKAKVTKLATENEALQQQLSCSQVQDLKEEIERARNRIKELWQNNCQQLLVHDNLMFEKEEEIKLLQSRVQQMGGELIKFKEGRTDQSAQTGTYADIPFPHSQTLVQFHT